MADDITLNPGVGGDKARAKDRATAKTQIMGIDVDPGGASEKLMSATNPAPVRISDGTAQATVNGTGTSAIGANTLPLGVVSGYYPNNTPISVPSTNDTFHYIIDPDGATQIRGGILSDEGSYYTSFPGSTLPPEVTQATGTGQTISVANSRLTIAAGTTANAEAYIAVPIDYLPLRCQMMIEISQRIANQDIYFELADGVTPGADTVYARFRWTGTTNTFVRCESQSSTDTNGNEGTSTDLTISATSTPTVYTLELSMLGASFLYGADTLESNLLAKRSNEIPGPYTPLYGRVRVKNGGVAPASNTNIICHWGSFQNLNRIDVNNSYQGEPLHVTTELEARVTTLPNKANDVDPIHQMGDGIGRTVVLSGMPREFVVTNNITLSNTSETTLISAGAAGVYHDLVSLIITNTSATAVRVDIRDATTGAVRIPIAIAANGGAIYTPPRAVPQTTAANNWTAQLSTSVTDVRIFAMAEKTK